PRARLATAVAPIYHRSPASMAQTAATVDDLSGGRFRLGLGTGHRITMSAWHGQRIGKPLAEMREYVSVVRALWAGRPATDGTPGQATVPFVGFTPPPATAPGGSHSSRSSGSPPAPTFPSIWPGSAAA